MSGSVARKLSGFGVRDEISSPRPGEVVTGDPDVEIRRGVRGVA